MSKLKLLDLCSGIGGMSLGLEATGQIETVAFCENAPFPRSILFKHWEGVPIYEDVSTLEYSGPVDMVAAGFPCQDISFAGKGAGLTGERSGLFWHIIRTVCMVGQPKVLLENVAALLNRGMGTVLGALAQIGYDAEWHCIPASYVGAWHQRDRVWIYADPQRKQHGEGGIKEPIFRQRHLSRQPSRVFEKWPGRSNLPAPTLNRTANGLSKELDSHGNAVVPQIPELIGHAILEAESAA
jgi:DNA (cytosine-5)-methyltransferase 1